MERKHYIDFMRGMAAILVVMQHTFFTDVDSRAGMFVSWFHNPVFFIASGVLLYGSLEKRKDSPRLGLYLRQALSLLLPFVIWNAIDLSVCLATGQPLYSFSSNAVWFLAVLFFAHCAIITVKDISNRAAVLAIAAVLLAAMVASSFYSSFIAKIFTFTLIVYIGFNIERLSPSKKAGALANAILFLLLCGTAAVAIGGQFTAKDGIVPGARLAISMLATTISSSTVLFTARNLDGILEKLPLAKVFCLLGTYTMQIYLIPFVLLVPLTRLTGNRFVIFILSLAIPTLIGMLTKDTLFDKILFRPAQLLKKRPD
ncbi:MAG: acyltransferase [Treponema sp.]|nr:acyltransferase [Treponema sp.]